MTARSQPVYQRTVRGWCVMLGVVGAVSGCGSCAGSSAPDGGPAPLDLLFHQEPRWLGGDGAYSIDLGNERTLWLFGDSFVATSPRLTRMESVMVRNSVAVMQGRDPGTAQMQFAWSIDGGTPSAYFENIGETWHWPGHGLRFSSGPLLVFLGAVEASSGGLGFTEAGTRAVLVSNPDEAPSAWQRRWVTVPSPPWDPTVVIGSAVVLDGDELVALTNGNHSQHTGWLVRWKAADARAGDLSQPQWWNGDAGWVPQGALSAAPVAVLPDAAPECSLFRDAASGRWVHVASRGFGATTIAVRFATDLTGPYSDAVDVYTPEESTGSNPFVYAGKAHPQLSAPTPQRLLATYATNSFTFGDLFTTEGERSLYWPRFVELQLPR